MKRKTFSRRDFLAGTAAAGAAILLPGTLSAAAEEKKMKKTFTILHTNDMHSNYIGMGPSSDYTPFTLNDDTTRGGYARLAGLIAKRKDNPAHPGEYFPRTSGMRFRYDSSRPKFDVVTAIEIGDLDNGYRAIDISGKDERLYSLTCPLMVGTILVGIPVHQGQAAFGSQEQGRSAPHVEGRGARRPSRRHARPAASARHDGQVLCRHWQERRGGPRDQGVAGDYGSPPCLAGQEQGELPTIPVDERAAEVRAIKVG